MIKRNFIKIACLAFVIGPVSILHAKPFIELKNIDLNKIHSAGFTLNSAGDFVIHGVGLLHSSSDEFQAMAWLLDGGTRQAVWVMDESNTKRSGRKGLRESNATLHLNAGRYELYYYAGNAWFGEIKIDDGQVFNFLGDLFEGKWPGNIESHLDEFFVNVSSAAGDFTDFATYRPDGSITDALIQFKQVGDDEYFEQGFTIDKPTTVRIRAFSEYPSGDSDPVDNCWITTADTRDRVWSVDRWNSDYAGGGRKNKVSDQDIDLPKGKYILYYMTDGSHSAEKFNVMAPYDPFAWGVALISTNKTDKGAFHLYTPEGRGTPLIQLTRVGDDEEVTQAFKLDKDMSLEIYALGEYSTWSRDFADYGWIENARDGKIAWEMTWRNTENAGGSKKNRIFDGAITLPKGSYIAHYITDDSHSFQDWNDTPPYDGKSWGISIFGGNDFDKEAFHLVNESAGISDPDILAKMTGLRDNANKRTTFSLDKRTKIRIYAVGEGDRDEMYDYGWIENENTGKIVWEMTWRNTEPAGGASKNRQYDDSVILESGKYTVHYITDGSHSFNDWNAAKPRDPSSWGISVTMAEN